MGRVGELLFFGGFFAAGCFFLVVSLNAWIVPQWRANHEFVETTCVVRGKELGRKQGEDGLVYRPEIQIEYTIDGRTYVTKTYDVCGTYTSSRADTEAILRKFKVGGEYPCWYDPFDPEKAVLARDYHWSAWLVLLVPITFIVIGGGRLVYRILDWGKSAERRAATAAGPLSLERLAPSAPEAVEYPGVPPWTDQTNSPGTRLKHRLPSSTSPVWQVVGLLTLCVFWNGIVGLFVYLVGRDHLAGDPNWLATAFLVPFAVVGIVLVFVFFRQLLVTTGVGPTWVEISDHPLRPGQAYDVLLSQVGRLRMNRLVMRLICQEEVRYQQGTDTRTETQCVFRQEVFRREDFQIEPAAPLEGECRVEIPPGAMHSLAVENNAVKWMLTVEGDVARWPNFSRSFPVIVQPADDAGGDRP